MIRHQTGSLTYSDSKSNTLAMRMSAPHPDVKPQQRQQQSRRHAGDHLEVRFEKKTEVSAHVGRGSSCKIKNKACKHAQWSSTYTAVINPANVWLQCCTSQQIWILYRQCKKSRHKLNWKRMWPTAPPAFSQPQPCHAALHCGELISMKDCGLWATMTCKLS